MKNHLDDEDPANPEDPYVGQGCLWPILYFIFGFATIFLVMKAMLWGLRDNDTVTGGKYAVAAVVCGLIAHWLQKTFRI